MAQTLQLAMVTGNWHAWDKKTKAEHLEHYIIDEEIGRGGQCQADAVIQLACMQRLSVQAEIHEEEHGISSSSSNTPGSCKDPRVLI